MTLRNSARGAFRDYRGEWREDPVRAAAIVLVVAADLLAAAFTVTMISWLIDTWKAL